VILFRFREVRELVTLREEPGELPNEKFVRFEHAGHLIYREHCEQFVAVVTAFLKES